MKTLWGAVLVLLSISPIIHATLTPLQVLSELPDCGSRCVLKAFEASNCSATDLHCICTNQQLNDQAAMCTESSCSNKDILTTKNVTLTSCGVPRRDKKEVVIYTGVIGGGIAVLAVLLRLIARMPGFAGANSGFGWDDCTMLAAMFCVVPMTVGSVILANLGLGRDIWTLSFNRITLILKLYYFDELLYINALTLTKISILLFYLRIFPQKEFRKWAYSLIGCCVVYSLLSSLLLIFQCTPLNLAWHRWDGEHKGHCTNLVPLTWITALLNVLLDVAIIVLPFPQLYKLNISTKKRLRVMVMFALGLFVTVISMLRLHWMLENADSKNPTWDWVTIGYWSVIEVDAGVLCACLPALRKLLLTTFPSLLDDASTPNSAASASSSQPSAKAPSSQLSIKNRMSYGSAPREFIPLSDIESESYPCPAYGYEHEHPVPAVPVLHSPSPKEMCVEEVETQGYQYHAR